MQVKLFARIFKVIVNACEAEIYNMKKIIKKVKEIPKNNAR